ncbi:response regulator [bacterium]|nr:response regulator [bacterium]
MKNIIKILLIDDDEDDYHLTRGYLAAEDQVNYELDWVSNYEEAREFLFKQEYDVYLIDFRLQTSTGLKLMEDVFGKPRLHKPIIILTGVKMADIDLQLIQTGATDYLVKSEVNATVLKKSIQYAIERYKVISYLFQKEQLNYNLFEQSIDIHFLLSKSLHISDINTAFSNTFDIAYIDAVGTPVDALFYEMDEWKLFEKQLKGEGRVNRMEVELKFNNTDVRSCLISCSEFSGIDGKVFGYQGVIHDVTEQKRAALEKKLTEKYALTGRLSRMIAHEVRNPLTNINLATSQLEKNADEAEKIYLEIIGRNALRINELISQLIKASLPVEIEKMEVDLNHIVESAVNLIHDRAALNGIEVTRDYDAALPLVSVDSQRMQIALTNLLVNGLEAIGDNKGKIAVKTRFLPNKKLVTIEISDTGCGMDAGTIKNLFEPFFTKKRNGTGLGLSTVRNIIKAHNGSIAVKSKQHVGTTFIMEIKP